jgi:hypothetical protein
MRENRLYGSEGGASNDRPYPYSASPLRGFEFRTLCGIPSREAATQESPGRKPWERVPALGEPCKGETDWSTMFHPSRCV